MKNYLAILSVALLAAPATTFAQNVSYTIKGSVEGLNAPTAYMYSRSGAEVKLDSTTVKNGKFTFAGENENASLSVVFLKGLKDRVTFYNNGGDIKITGKSGHLASAAVTGVPAESAKDLYNKTSKAYTAVLRDTVLYNQYKKANAEKDTATIEKIMKKVRGISAKVQAQHELYVYAFPKDEVSLVYLRNQLSSGDYAALNKTFSTLDTSLQNSKKGQSVAKQLDIMKKVAVGQPAIAFTQNDVNDKPVSLADFKGKYVLVDFWASWCGPCRAENPNVVKAYNQYKDKNFTILGVSLDSKKENWLKAIKDDKLDWTQVSDLKGWKNEVAAKYGVRAIPANFLIDPNGKIIGHSLRGEDLEKKLAEIFK